MQSTEQDLDILDDVTPALPPAPATEDDDWNLEAYLDTDASANALALEQDDELLDREQEFEQAEKKPGFWRRPSVKMGGTIGGLSVGLIVVMSLFMRGCESPSTKGAIADKPLSPDKRENLLLKKRLQQMYIDNENLTRQRQAKGLVFVPGAKKTPPKGKTPAAKNVVSPSQPRYERSYPRLSQPYQPRPFIPVSRPAAPPTQSSGQTSEIAALKAQIAQLVARAQEPKVPEVVAQEPPQLQNVVATEETLAAQPVNGGIEAAALMSDRAIASIPAGQRAKAVLEVPITGTGSPVVLSLASEIKDATGQVIMPVGTQMMGYADLKGAAVSVNIKSAIVNGVAMDIPATTAIINGQSVEVPAIAVMDGRKPLLAKKAGGGNGLGKILLGAGLDAASAFVGQMIAPTTTSSISSNGSTAVQTTNAPSTLTNAGLAAAGGAASNLGNGLKQTLTASGQQQGTTQAVNAGTKIDLVFTRPVDLLADASLPPEEVNSSVNAAYPLEPQEEVPQGWPALDSLQPPDESN